MSSGRALQKGRMGMLQTKYSKTALTKQDITIMIDVLLDTNSWLLKEDKTDPRINLLNGIMTKLLKMRDGK